jgi:hypothetical protein
VDLFHIQEMAAVVVEKVRLEELVAHPPKVTEAMAGLLQ